MKPGVVVVVVVVVVDVIIATSEVWVFVMYKYVIHILVSQVYPMDIPIGLLLWSKTIILCLSFYLLFLYMSSL